MRSAWAMRLLSLEISVRRPLSCLFLPSDRNAGDQKGDDVDDGPVDDHGSRRDTDKRHTG